MTYEHSKDSKLKGKQANNTEETKLKSEYKGKSKKVMFVEVNIAITPEEKEVFAKAEAETEAKIKCIL
ncbi:hypothetical protein F5884DRAFT_856253 [Xylogone sp. PMI_703]|nr:hypothetical protein F5884DRAFT_856253 [Xylogone sp. PMI_703]